MLQNTVTTTLLINSEAKILAFNEVAKKEFGKELKEGLALNKVADFGSKLAEEKLLQGQLSEGSATLLIGSNKRVGYISLPVFTEEQNRQENFLILLPSGL